MKRIVYLFLLISSISFSQTQTPPELGNVSREEIDLKTYLKDEKAFGLYLNDYCKIYHNKKDNFRLTKYYYAKIKVFNKDEFSKENAELRIRFFDEEKVKNINVITYNFIDNKVVKTRIDKSSIFENDLSNKWKEKVLTFPNIKNGSVIEYSYEITSPYYNLEDWRFQTNIPKLRSEYNSSIISNYKYKIRLNGFLKLDKDKPSIIKNCFNSNSYGGGSCIKLHYVMKDVPSFKEEDYLTSKENYISKLIFDLESFTSYKKGTNYVDDDSNVKKVVKSYIETWEDADKTLKKRMLNNQTSKKRFFKKNIPNEIFNEKNELTKANKIYNYIVEKYFWNKKYWSIKNNVKNSFKEGSGSVDEINLSLYNSLQAANIESYPVVVSTRANGFPSKLYPITKDFNYIIIKAVINNKDYFLDATSKFLPFGDLPLRCLNGEGRVLDFKEGSYWQKIKANSKNSIRTKVELKIEESKLTGNLSIQNKGFYALNKRQKLSEIKEEDFVDDIETIGVEIDNFKFENKELKNKALIENYELIFDDNIDSEITNINPFFSVKKNNPFKLKERLYPVDFGYTFSETTLISIKVPENYSIKKIPESKTFSTKNKGAIFILNVKKTGAQVNIYTKLQVSKKIFKSEDYTILKEFYNQIIEEEKSIIQLEKIK